MSEEGSSEPVDEGKQEITDKDRLGWAIPRPEVLPAPTYWPSVLSIGLVLLLLGFVTSLIVSVVGTFLVVLALRGWISEMRGGNGQS